MRQFIKIIAIGLGLVVIGLAGITLTLRILFPSAKLRERVTEEIRKHLHREAQLGDVRLGIRGISLGRFKLSEVSTFSAGTFLAVEHLEIRWALLPLLSKKIQITHVILEKPQINLIRMSDGATYNVSDLAGAATPPSASAPAKADTSTHKEPARRSTSDSGWTWQVDEIDLHHGGIRFDDRSAARQTSALSDIDVTLQDFTPERATGRVTIAQLSNPVYTAKDLSVEWALKDIDPMMTHLNGWMRLQQGPGLIQNLNTLANSSRAAKLALMPLVMLQSIDKLGFVKLGLPDFSRLNISQIQGDYVFKDGTMTIKTFQISGPQATVSAVGTIVLKSGALAVDVALHTPQPTLMGEMDLKMQITGTLSNPQTNLDSLKKKAFKATVNQLLTNPDAQKKINDALKGFFH